MGFVYKAYQRALERFVALKILSPSLSGDPAFAERFAREARVLGKLNHPNIVTVFEHGESGGFFYLIMEHVDGVNLRQAMRAGRFTPAQALAVVPGICDALQAAHAQGVWHRDIKPENILLDAQGGVKIVDFGIARIVGDPQRDFTLTMTGAALGSAAYMAPEQHEKPHDVDHRADIYSLGVVIYEMLTGELPLGRFKAPSTKAAVDARIDEIVFRTLEKERELRQQSAAEVKTDVFNAASGQAPAPEEKKGMPQKLILWVLGLTLGGATVAGMGGFIFSVGDQGRNGHALMVTGAVFAALGALAFVLGFAGMLLGFYQLRRGTMMNESGNALRSLATLLIVGIAWAAVAHAVNHYRDGLALSLGIAAAPLAGFAVHRLWRGKERASGTDSSNDSSGPSSGTPAVPAPILFASKSALIGGLVLFIAGAVFTHGSTEGVLLAIAATVFVLGAIGLLFGRNTASGSSSAEVAPVTVLSLWLFLGGICTFAVGEWIRSYGFRYFMLAIDLMNMGVPDAMRTFGAVSAIVGWCGILHALSQMKRGVISTRLRGFARTCAWLPAAFLLFAALLFPTYRVESRQKPTAVEPLIPQALEKPKRPIDPVELAKATQANAGLKTRFHDLSTPEGAVVAYYNALDSADVSRLLASIPKSTVAQAENTEEYARELIAKNRKERIGEDHIYLLISVAETNSENGALDVPSRRRILGREPGWIKFVEYEIRVLGQNPGSAKSTEVCVREDGEWRVIPRSAPTKIAAPAAAAPPVRTGRLITSEKIVNGVSTVERKFVTDTGEEFPSVEAANLAEQQKASPAARPVPFHAETKPMRIHFLPGNRLEVDGKAATPDELVARLRQPNEGKTKWRFEVETVAGVEGRFIADVLQKMKSVGAKFDEDVMAKLRDSMKASTYSILGQVNQPGQMVSPDDPMTVSKAITLAGGPTRLAALDKVQLIRTDADGATKTTTVDVKKALAGKATPEEDPVVLPGDRINVPESVF
jgi:hypothetical protein